MKAHENGVVDDEVVAVEMRDAQPPNKERARRRVLWLVLMHAALLLTLPWSQSASPMDFLSITYFFGIIFAQNGLMGTWMAMGSSRFELRLLAFVGYWILQAAILANVLGSSETVFIAMALWIWLAAFAVWCIVRCTWVSIQWFPNPLIPLRQRFQFSILNLMVITSATAIVFGIRHAWHEFAFIDSDLEMFIILSCSFLLAPLISVWAALGTGRIWARCILVLGVCAAVGPVMEIDITPEWLLPTVLIFQAILIIASLLVVRSNGYRLVRISGAGAQPEPGQLSSG
jgi:hypothetical protein